MISAYIGAFSHVLLDGIMHDDMRPFFPLTDANPAFTSCLALSPALCLRTRWFIRYGAVFSA